MKKELLFFAVLISGGVYQVKSASNEDEIGRLKPERIGKLNWLMLQKAGAPVQIVAAAKGDLTALKLCVRQGKNMNIRFNGFTPLMQAILQGNFDIVRFLLDRGSEIKHNAIDLRGVLHYFNRQSLVAESKFLKCLEHVVLSDWRYLNREKFSQEDLLLQALLLQDDEFQEKLDAAFRDPVRKCNGKRVRFAPDTKPSPDDF